MIEKKLRREQFNILDSALSCVTYLVLQFVFLTLYASLPKDILGSSIVTNIAQILVEGVFLLSVFMTARIRDVDFVKATTFKSKIDAKIILYGLITAFVTMICFAPLTDLFLYAVQSLGYKYVSQPIDVSNFGLFILCLIVHCAVPAICEEGLFRGSVCAGLRGVGKHFAVIISALIFSFMHGWPVQTMHQFIIGLVLGYLFVETGNIWLPIFTHFFNNAISITMLYMQNIIAPDTVLSESKLIEFVPVETSVLLLNIGYAIVMAGLGVMLTIILIRTMKRHIESKNKKVENEVKEELQENLNSENVVEDVKQENVSKPKNILKSEKFWAIICFVIVAFSLISDWVIALINGLNL